MPDFIDGRYVWQCGDPFSGIGCPYSGAGCTHDPDGGWDDPTMYHPRRGASDASE